MLPGGKPFPLPAQPFVQVHLGLIAEQLARPGQVGGGRTTSPGWATRRRAGTSAPDNRAMALRASDNGTLRPEATLITSACASAAAAAIVAATASEM